MRNLRVITVLLAIYLFLASCRGHEGDPGPAGATGAQGDKGDNGDPGSGEQNSSDKAGYFQGIVQGNRTDGTAFSESFMYEYIIPGELEYFSSDGRILFQRNQEDEGFGEILD